VNGAYYRDNLLAQKLLSEIFWISHGGIFVFRQDDAMVLWARDIVAFRAKGSLHDFIPQTLWTLTSPDLNPVVYSICSVLQEKIYPSRIANVGELKTRLIDEWERFDHSIRDVDIDQWRRRLSACVRVSGAHFEHQFTGA